MAMKNHPFFQREYIFKRHKFSIAMLKHTRGVCILFWVSKIYNDGRSREVYFGLGPGKMDADKVSQKTSNGPTGGNGQNS